jgi:hypothetical protein
MMIFLFFINKNELTASQRRYFEGQSIASNAIA